MPLLEPGTIMIDEDEFNKDVDWVEYESGCCPKCDHGGMQSGDNYCSNCGVKITWFTKKEPDLQCDGCKSFMSDAKPRRYFGISIRAMTNRTLCDGCYADIRKVEVPEGFKVAILPE